MKKAIDKENGLYSNKKCKATRAEIIKLSPALKALSDYDKHPSKDETAQIQE